MAAVERSTGAAPKSLTNLFYGPHAQCQRCHKSVYQAEKVGPINGVLFHRQCFRCTVCMQHLTVKTYHLNPVELQDKEIYCVTHVPQLSSHGLDGQAMGIRRALNAPKQAPLFNDQIHSSSKIHVNNDAMHIQGALRSQTQLQSKYKMDLAKHNFPAFLVTKREEIYKAQEVLESKQRVEEDRLMKKFENERKEIERELNQEIEVEWEERLKELTQKFDQEMYKKTKGKKMKDDDKRALTIHYNKQKEELERNMTVKISKKKQALTVKLVEKEQLDTSDMVKKHSAQMLELLAIKKKEIERELEQELKEKARKEAEEEAEAAAAAAAAMALQQQPSNKTNGRHGSGDGSDIDIGGFDIGALAAAVVGQTELPVPHPPRCRKRDLYTDPIVFKDLDEEVFKVAEAEQETFTDLVRLLTQHCISDLEKARAIFRWITVKDLNVIEFDEALGADSPMNLLRGIKFGTETYHVLFMRLCSYAGLPCVEIKGHSKSVGYEPGMKMKPDQFQNTWNAVLIDGDWRLVQCNWGARHLVLNKDQERPARSRKHDKIRYQYDEHYFLTDPDEMIQEFWAKEAEWQLLDVSITLEEFEAMPFVRSVFFHHGMEFEGHPKSVLYTDNKGGADVKIRIPHELSQDLVFHYQLRFADKERRSDTDYKGAKLERFVFHSLVDDHALFSVHVPAVADYFLEIFANRIDDSNKIGDDPNAPMMPFRLKCACKFKVVCKELVGKMHPLPNCASGEWGPSKGQRHFGISPITHRTGVVNHENEVEIRFQLPRPLHFLIKLRANGIDDHMLESYVSHGLLDNVLVVKVRPPQPGQYGLDMYARPEDATDNHTLAHACKYLINCAKVDKPTDLPMAKIDSAAKMSKDKWGPSSQFDKLSMKALNHKDPKISVTEGSLSIDFALGEPLQLSYHLVREPDEDHRDNVRLSRENEKRIAKFQLNLPRPGNYLFAIYGRKDGSNSSMVNVYNYMIRFNPDGSSSTMKKEKSKKSLFGKK